MRRWRQQQMHHKCKPQQHAFCWTDKNRLVGVFHRENYDISQGVQPEGFDATRGFAGPDASIMRGRAGRNRRQFAGTARDLVLD